MDEHGHMCGDAEYDYGFVDVRLTIAMLLALLALPAAACDAVAPCRVAHGEYYVRPPAKWDGRSPLPAAIFFHGYRSSARQAMDDAALGAALSEAGVMLVAPDGLRGSWSAAPALSTGRDDIAFTREVLADLRARFPLDPARSVATGFSAGGFMVWRLACEAGGLFAAYAPIAGAFLDPVPARCPTGPVSLRHVHGLADSVVPMTGRPIAGGRVRQSDVENSMARLRAVDACPQTPTRVAIEGDLTCRIWTSGDCASGRELELCLHAGGHRYEAGWIVDAMGWAARLPPPAPR